MSPLADLAELVGFFAYSREDDEDSRGALPALRDAIQRELGAQLGRSRRGFRLWQNMEAIAPGPLWESEIKTAVEQSVFFIPIVTPRAVSSNDCLFEFEVFLARERGLGRSDLVFPILYIGVPALEREAQWRSHPVLSIIGTRQYVDWRRLRLLDVRSHEVAEQVEHFCANISRALRAPILTPRERQEETASKTAGREEQAGRDKAEVEARLLEAQRAAAEHERLEREAAATLETEKRVQAGRRTTTHKIFISYRRDDSAGHAGRVFDRLTHEFGRDLLFMDVDAIPLGVNFVKALREEVAKCEVLLAVIGPNWLSVQDEGGKRRLDSPNDFVRVEIAAALQRDIPVIPILLDGTKIPRADQLPTDIDELALRQALNVRYDSFHADMDRLIKGLRAKLG